MIQKVKTKPEDTIAFDFGRFRLPTFVTELRPLLFIDGDSYYARLSLEDENEIAGRGISPEDALIDWNDKNCARLSGPVSEFGTANRYSKKTKNNPKTKRN